MPPGPSLILLCKYNAQCFIAIYCTLKSGCISDLWATVLLSTNFAEMLIHSKPCAPPPPSHGLGHRRPAPPSSSPFPSLNPFPRPAPRSLRVSPDNLSLNPMSEAWATMTGTSPAKDSLQGLEWSLACPIQTTRAKELTEAEERVSTRRMP